MNDFRLRTDVRPERYDLAFDLDLDRWTSTGRATIALRTTAPLRELTLHSVDLDITAASIDGQAMTGVRYDEEAQTATIAFVGEIAAGQRTVVVEWRGEILKALRGLYRSTRGEERYAATQFEAADARRAFPCFDEPEFKARFAVEVTHPSELVAVGNMGVTGEHRAGPARKRTRFEPTPPISSYLLAFAVGPFEITPEARTQAGVPVRVLVPPGLASQALFARDAHVRSLDWLVAYTALPYPFTKVDAIAIPDFEAGAMENPGAITYRVTYLAADERTASIGTLKAVFSVAAHELTHMWWGDLVTMAWWTDLWLNESFASFVGEKATDELHPEWGYGRDIVAQNTSAFNLDSLVSTHPISVEAKNVDEASERFDSVTYLKGQGVLRMLENFIGADAFRAGVRVYLRRHEWANATADDFWRALDESSGRDISRVANAWIHEPGHPLVACRARREGDAEGGVIPLVVELTQSRFFADPAVAPTEQRWPVPLVFRYGTADGVREHRVVLEGERTTVRLPGARWYYPNGGGTGFYRTALDDDSLRLLADNIASLTPEERLAVLDNVWALARASKASVGQVLELVAALRGEEDRAVLQQLHGILDWLGTHAVRPDTEPRFRWLVDSIFRPQLEKVGWDPRQDDSADEREKRGLVIAALGGLAAAADVRAEARQRVDAHLAGSKRIDPDTARATVGVAAAEGDEALYQKYVQRMRSAAADDAQEEARFRSALCDFEDPRVVDRFRTDLYTEMIREQDRGLLVLRQLASRHGREQGWEALKAHWESHVAGTDPGTKQRFVNAAGQLTPKPLAADAIRFLREKQTPDIKENVAQATERVRILSANAERMAGELGDALGRITQPV